MKNNPSITNLKKKSNLIFVLHLLVLFVISCNKEDTPQHYEFKFIEEYCDVVTVGGVVGIADKCFEVGEIVSGTDYGGKTITIRIAEHSNLNEGPPSSASYQEFLEVPRDYLKIAE